MPDWGKVKFFLGEVARSFTRNTGMQVTAIVTVAVTIALLGTFLWTQAVLARFGADLLRQVEISVYMRDDATPAQEAALRAMLARDARVAMVRFIPKKEGLAELERRTRGILDFSILTQNPLPDKLRVRVPDAGQIPAVAREIRAMPGVAKVVYGRTVLVRLLQLGTVAHRVALLVLAVFILVAGIVISNTIRLTIFARRREIGIMQLVGATGTYVRLPFVCEGLLDGVLGAALAVLLLAIAKMLLWPRLLVALPWVPIAASPLRASVLAGDLIAAGALLGTIASWISVNRYLEV
jgi:cell division transport system permease protein